MRSTPPRRARRRVTTSTALIGVAAIAVLGMQAVPATAQSPAKPPAKGDPGQLPAKVSPTEYKALVGKAKAQQDETASALNVGDKVELKAKSVLKNQDGTTHTRYTQTYDGLPVIGGDIIVHRAPSGAITRVTQSASKPMKVNTAPATLVSTKPNTPKAAGSVAPRKVVWMDEAGDTVLAWETVVGGTQKDGTPNRLHVLTDATTGKKIIEWQGVQTGTGRSMYSGTVELGTSQSGGSYTMRDTGRGNHETTDLRGAQSGKGTLFTDTDDQWGNGAASDRQTAGVDAAYGAGQTWDYYKTVFGRAGIRGDGVGAYSRVHYGQSYVNAFWEDGCFCMTYGDGQGNSSPLTELDVAGHEMTHGVTSNTAGLIYQGESGGLNEATSDILATAMEFWSNNPADVGDYHIGEKIDIFGTGAPLRYMAQPSKDGNSLDNWKPGAGNVDVHYSSGIANHFFYLLSEGSGQKVINGVTYNSPTYDSKPVTGIGRDKAAAIWYKALTEEMRPTTNFADARRATLAAAAALYGGENSTEWKTTANAWAAVNVGARVDDNDPPDDNEPPGDTTWADGKTYNAGDVVTYEGVQYRCLQSHTSMPGWTPPNVPALWEAI
ncbi:M4 family metallopeptidase [Actinomadura sp. 3N508]|uniref:M4 family metallopeptidase n=1 Tax=Actinomadura sp. 3N508 TaxID=3375153 RepID=UPI00379096B5